MIVALGTLSKSVNISKAVGMECLAVVGDIYRFGRRWPGKCWIKIWRYQYKLTVLLRTHTQRNSCVYMRMHMHTYIF